MDAKKAITELSYIYEGANKFLADELFLSCLNEEIELFWKDRDITEALLCFKFQETGELIYQGIFEKVEKDKKPDLMVKLPNEKKLKEIEDSKKAKAEKTIEENLAEISKVELDKKKHELLDYLLKGKK